MVSCFPSWCKSTTETPFSNASPYANLYVKSLNVLYAWFNAESDETACVQVTFDKKDHAMAAMNRLQRFPIWGRPLRLSFSQNVVSSAQYRPSSAPPSSLPYSGGFKGITLLFL
jgi:hypothetical protein